MSWDITGEWLSAIVIIIIMVYSRKGNLLPSLRNIVYQICLRVTFVAVCVNILSTILLQYIHEVPYGLNYSVLVIYFICTPLMGAIYFLYTMTNIYENDYKVLMRYSVIAFIPAIMYTLIVLLNPFFNVLFTLDLKEGYQQGSGSILTYIIFYYYVILSIIMVVYHHKKLEKEVKHILMIFPIISGVVILFQFFNPQLILNGFAATCALLIVYMNLQNKEIFTDNLTRLLNRQEFRKMVETKINSKKPFYVLVLSLKEFKFINDKFGLVTGDKLLISLCEYLKSIVPAQHLYRYSGDEFAIITDSNEALTDYVMQFRLRMKEPWNADPNELVLHYVMGSIAYPEVAVTSKDIIKGLEYIVARAKLEKGDLYTQCSCDILTSLERKYEIVEILKETVASDSFVVLFQPIYDAVNDRFTNAEALVRLPENRLGFVGPDEFIPIAEETGLIVNLTYSVLRKTCAFIRHMMDEGRTIEGVSVNFSVVQFMQEDLEEKIIHIIDEYKIPYGTIKIEVTESVLTTNFETIEQFIEHMSRLGIRFLMDDFGTGYSNFTYAISIPFHTIKIDKTLIHQAIKDTRTAILIAPMILAFKKLNFKVLAEGIETKDELSYALHNGCDFIQGYYYSRPLSADDAFRFFTEKQQYTMECIKE